MAAPPIPDLNLNTSISTAFDQRIETGDKNFNFGAGNPNLKKNRDPLIYAGVAVLLVGVTVIGFIAGSSGSKKGGRK